MKDVLHIVGLLKQQAETALATKTKRKADALAHIEQIKTNILKMGHGQSAQMDGLVYERWCNHQRLSLSQIQASLPILEQDIRLAFAKLETVQAKLTSAESLAQKQDHERALLAESAEEDAMLELSLLRRGEGASF